MSKSAACCFQKHRILRDVLRFAKEDKRFPRESGFANENRKKENYQRAAAVDLMEVENGGELGWCSLQAEAKWVKAKAKAKAKPLFFHLT